MMTSRSKLYRRYGAILREICYAVGWPPLKKNKDKIHKLLKENKSIDSLKDLTNRELWEYIYEIEAHFMSEYGVELLPEKKSLKELFEENDNAKENS